MKACLKFNNTIVIILLLINLSQLVSGCGEGLSTEPLRLSDELSLMTAEERQNLAPNPAFEAVWLRNPGRLIKVLEEERSLFLTRNAKGQTPLMVAIHLREKEISRLIIDSLSRDELLVKDQMGRGYVSHAAEQGYIQLIESIVDKYKESMMFSSLFRMPLLDFPDNLGRHALFYAANSATADRLKDFWMQWPVSHAMSGTWYSGFYQKLDNDDHNFMHPAAHDNRHDLLRWAIMQVCGNAIWEDSRFLFGGASVAGQVLDWMAGFIQLVPFLPSDMVNRQNVYGDTPLHVAVRHGHRQSARAIMSCRNTRYTLTNQAGRTPLAEMLAHMDPNIESVGDNFRDIFDSLTQMQNRYRMWWRNLQDIINTQDHEGKSALHYAARLKDAYYYNQLKELGDIYLLDKQEMTPEGIFNSRHR